MLFPSIWAFCGSCGLSYASQRLHHGIQYCKNICLFIYFFGLDHKYPPLRQYVEPSGKDVRLNVRTNAENIVSLLNDKDKIHEVRNKAANCDK